MWYAWLSWSAWRIQSVTTVSQVKARALRSSTDLMSFIKLLQCHGVVLSKTLATTVFTGFEISVPRQSEEHLRNRRLWPNLATRSLLRNVSRCRNSQSYLIATKKSIMLCTIGSIQSQLQLSQPTAQYYLMSGPRCDARSAFEKAPARITRETACSDIWLVRYHIWVRQQHS